jgi:Ankyrin repeats (3 copies)
MLTSPILANIGLPTVALYLPFAWFALVPIILIEAGYGARQYNLSFRRAFLAQATANCLSTLIGIPITWLVLVLIQFVTLPGGVGPAWLLPDPRWWNVTLAIAVLTVVFYFMSVVTEGFIVARFFREIPRQTIRRWMIQANGITYVLLVALIFVGFVAPKVSEPMLRVMEPVNEAIIDGVFWMVDQVSGDKKKEPPLIKAVEAGDLKKAQQLIASGANVNQTDDFGFPALSIAASRADENMTKLLLDAGAKVNSRSATLHDTALARAAQDGNGPTVRVLLAAGAQFDDKDGSGWTPLFNAALKGDLEIVEALLSAGADVNVRSSTGWTALKEAQMRGYQRIAERLKRAGAIDFPDGAR